TDFDADGVNEWLLVRQERRDGGERRGVTLTLHLVEQIPDAAPLGFLYRGARFRHVRGGTFSLDGFTLERDRASGPVRLSGAGECRIAMLGLVWLTLRSAEDQPVLLLLYNTERGRFRIALGAPGFADVSDRVAR